MKAILALLLTTFTFTAALADTAQINGTEIYYEIHGKGEALILLHGGGSDMEVSFGKAIPELAKNFKVIAIDEQGHGKSPASNRKFGFENTADDVAELLKQLKIEKAMFVGFSNGATTGMYIAIRHPKLLSRAVLGSGLYSKKGAPPQFWEFMKKGTFAQMPQELKEAYAKRAVKPADVMKMYEYDATRMRSFRDIPEKAMRGVETAILIMQTDQDVATVEHAVHVMRLLPQARLAILPGPHDNFLGSVSKATPAQTQTSLNIIREFLSAPATL